MGAKKRWCPAAHEPITSQQCGEGREDRYLCPLDCEYLAEARLHEKMPDVNPDEFPNRDIQVTEEFLRRNEPLLLFAARTLLTSALEGDATDGDVREALAALIKTYRTLESGLIYDSRPANPYAAALYERMREGTQRLAEEIQQQTGLHNLGDADMLGVFVFLEDLAIQHDNGRPRGRRFLDFLRLYFPAQPAGDSEPPPNSPLLTGP
ncbi:MAG: hypothetical protein ABI972_17300 [Acidobacteriota bacterium]